MNMPRIGYLVSRYPAVSHTFILREVEALRAQGLQIATASINPPDFPAGAMPREESSEAAHTYYVKAHGPRGALLAHAVSFSVRPLRWFAGLRLAARLARSPREFLRGLAYFTEALMIDRWMTRERLGHLHIHFATAAANVGLYLKAVRGVSLSLTLHGPDEFDDVPGQWLRQKIEAADFIFCIGHHAKSQVMRLSSPRHWDKIDIARLGVEHTAFSPRLPGTPINILCVGRLVPAKGQRMLILAARRLIRSGFDLKLTLVGSGPDEAALKALVDSCGLGQQVSFTGALNRGQVAALYRTTDLFVLPSFAEGIPVVLMEAMAHGLPCVSTRITGIPELIQRDAEGLLVPPADEEALGHAMARLMASPRLRHAIGRAAARRVNRDFDLTRNTAKLATLFRQRLGGAT